MAMIESGLDDLLRDMEALTALPEPVLNKMNDVQAEVVARYQREAAQGLNIAGYGTGQTASAVTTKSSRYSARAGTHQAYVTFKGVRKDGKRAAEVAFLNEFGSKTISARQWIRLANERASQEALAAAERVYDQYLKTRNL